MHFVHDLAKGLLNAFLGQRTFLLKGMEKPNLPLHEGTLEFKKNMCLLFWCVLLQSRH